MEDLSESIVNVIENNSKDLSKVLDEEERKNSVSYRIDFDSGSIFVRFEDLGKDSSHKFDVRRDEERYKFSLHASLDYSSHIPDVKSQFYEVRDVLIPESEVTVTQDYPTHSVDMEEYLKEETVRNNLLSI